MSHHQRRARRRNLAPLRSDRRPHDPCGVAPDRAFGLGAPAGWALAATGGVSAADLMQQPGVVSLAALAAGAGAGLLYVTSRGGMGAPRTGFASKQEIATLGAKALVRRRATLRPSLASVAGRDISPMGLGWRLGLSRPYRVPIYSSCEDATLVIGPPRQGKSGLLGNAVAEAPGAVLCTSTKADLLHLTGDWRGRRGRVWVFSAAAPEDNPPQNASLPPLHAFTWSPVAGCRDPQVAMRRAGYLLSGSGGAAGTENRAFWEEAAYKALKSMLLVADLAGLGMAEVATWARNPQDKTPLTLVERLKSEGASIPAGWEHDLAQVMNGPDKTRDSVYMTLSMSLAFMASPRAAALTLGGDDAFDIDAFLAGGADTLYMIGEDTEYGGIGPLFSALAGEVFEAAKALAARMPSGRLDPPLTMVIDEAALICPIPLPRWSSDSGGRGVTLHVAVQSPAQMYATWGKYEGQTIWSNCTKIVMGGIGVVEHLEDISKLCGEQVEIRRSRSEGQNGASTSEAESRVPVMTPTDIRTIPRGQALLLHRSLRPVMFGYTNIWDHPGIAKWRRDEARHAKQAERRTRRKSRRAERRGASAPLAPVAPPTGPAVPGQVAAAPLGTDPAPVVPPRPEHLPPVAAPPVRITSAPPNWPMPVTVLRPTDHAADGEDANRGAG
ncbi:TraM recognition domain-containing protein [Yinghuangia sp. ASG 101]|uniref:type IV secretory system conjugative DNA transfer family protein n=1 Tax=Yinghuangia sp. ASG 101 TaxID=2896848 RepID=UPI001E637AAE|nr:type IV secretory system conjugative DNA transfer family protein [Yinghuangia sp. ASG 101]UGQ14988.1 TraM recognition domain-containing protein [Yinghuangia sp. ASG 101]